MNPTHATVRHTPLRGKTVPECLSTIDTICSTAAQSPDVQASPVALQALSALQKAVTASHASVSARQSLAQALLIAMKAMASDFATVKVMLDTYEAAVNALAAGSPTIINKAGLLTRDGKPPPTALGKVTVVHTKPGKHATEAILSWPAGPGATGYAIEVNYTPQNPAGTWTALTSGTGRRRVVKSPTPASQLLARVASLGSDGTQADWSDPVLVTTL